MIDLLSFHSEKTMEEFATFAGERFGPMLEAADADPVLSEQYFKLMEKFATEETFVAYTFWLAGKVGI